MPDLGEIFELLIAEDLMRASLQLRDEYDADAITKEQLLTFLKNEKVNFGIDEEAVQKVISSYEPLNFPMTIALGKEAVNGIDGQIDFVSDQDDYFSVEERRSFRDVKKIPSVAEGEKIAVIIDPVEGEDGHTVTGKPLPAKKGKAVRYKAGKNVHYDEEDQSFYSEAIGKLSVGGSKINVYDTYELSEDLSMKTGNVHFSGSVIIRGNVPAGYQVIADGDVQIYGLVEAGHIQAGGSVVISEGIAGLKKGSIEAAGDITIGYVNQAKLEAGGSIHVKNSIMHSECTAKEHVYCLSGNIIGGVCSGGITIEAKDIGNKMDTRTEVAIGIDSKAYQLEGKLIQARESLEAEITKLSKLGQALEMKAKVGGGLSSKERVFLLKQKNTMQVTEGKLEKINEQIEGLHVQLGDENRARLIAKGTIYPNVDLCFGKYQQTTNKEYKFTQVYIQDGEIKITPL